MEIWGILRVLVSYEITRGIRLVVGRVTERVQGGSGLFWGGQGWSTVGEGGLLDPQRTLVAPLKVFWGTRFNSKHDIMVQLVNIYGESANDPFLDLCGPTGGSRKKIICANTALLEHQKVPKIHILGPKCVVLKSDHPDGPLWIKSGPFGLSGVFFRGQKARS